MRAMPVSTVAFWAAGDPGAGVEGFRLAGWRFPGVRAGGSPGSGLAVLLASRLAVLLACGRAHEGPTHEKSGRMFSLMKSSRSTSAMWVMNSSCIL